jgi:hypothetical protein
MLCRRVIIIPLALAVTVPMAGARTFPPAERKARAEIDVLRAAAHSWNPRRISDLVDPRTHLLRNNTTAICHGRGRPQRGNRYTRFVCVVRPRIHRPRQGLYVLYRALPAGRWRIHWLSYRRR